MEDEVAHVMVLELLRGTLQNGSQLFRVFIPLERLNHQVPLTKLLEHGV